MASIYRREVLQQALAIIWRKKYLWFIAFFAGLASYGGEINFLFRKLNAVTTFQTYLVAVRSVFVEGKAHPYLQQFQSVFQQSPGSVIGYVVLVMAMLAVIFWLMFVSEGALMRIVGRTQEKKTNSFFDGISTGTEKFWSIIQVNVIGLLFGWATWIVVAGLPATIYFVSGNAAWSEVARVGAIISVVASAVISLVIQYATAGIVLRNLTAMQSVIDSWRLFRRNWLVSLEMAIIIFLVNLLVLIVTFGIYDVLGLFFSVTGLIILFSLLAIEFAALSAFSYSAWTIMYLQLVSGSAHSKIGEWTTQLVNFSNKKTTV